MSTKEALFIEIIAIYWASKHTIMVPIDTLRVQQYYTFLLEENIIIFEIISGFFIENIDYILRITKYKYVNIVYQPDNLFRMVISCQTC